MTPSLTHHQMANHYPTHHLVDHSLTHQLVTYSSTHHLVTSSLTHHLVAYSLTHLLPLQLTPYKLPQLTNSLIFQSKLHVKVRQYSKLSDDDEAKVESILYLIDKFGVGDEFMHELSMVVDGLPKSYLFKQCQKDLNMGCIITSTPGRAPGAQYSFKQLLADRIKHMVSTSSTRQVIFCPKFSFFL